MTISRRYDWLTFDCYGTLIDWEAGISGAFLRRAEADGIELRNCPTYVREWITRERQRG